MIKPWMYKAGRAWLSGWSYRKSITLSRASGAVTNYQMKLLVGESAETTTGSDIVTNGNFSVTTGWSTYDCSILSVAGGQSGNCCQLTRTGGTNQQVNQAPTTVIGSEYIASVYVKSGTSGAESASLIAYDSAWGVLGSASTTTTDSWQLITCKFIATENHVHFYLFKSSATAGTMLFDTASLYLILNPSAVDCGGLCASDFDDIRFTKSDGTTVLDYWIESISGTTPNQVATIWIEFDSIGTGDTTFYMYYGNSGAAAYSNGANTFTFFDHFDGDASKWAGDTAQLAIASSIGTLTATGTAWKKVYGNVASTSDGAMRTRATLQNNIAYTSVLFADSASTYNDCIYALSDPASTNDSLWDTYKAGTKSLVSNASIGGDAYHIFELRRTLDGTDTSSCFIDDVQAGANTTTNVPTTNLYASMMAYGNTNHVHIDWVLIRYYLPTEPAWGAWGAQET
jgi:hypothetical protein